MTTDVTRVVSPQPWDCPEYWFKGKEPGSCFKRTWLIYSCGAALDQCKEQEGSLAVIGSEEENNYVMKYLSMDSFYSGVFIGMHCEATYTNWAANQGGGCALMDRSGKWHDSW